MNILWVVALALINTVYNYISDICFVFVFIGCMKMSCL